MSADKSANLLLEPPKYRYTEKASGVWQEFLYENGRAFRRYRSHRKLSDQPLVCIAYGVDPETGRMAVAEGFIAIGQWARGRIAIGQFATGTVALGQFALGRLAAIGQFAIAPLAAGQFTIALAGIGMMGISATGIFWIGVTLFGGIGRFLLSLSQFLA